MSKWFGWHISLDIIVSEKCRLLRTVWVICSAFSWDKILSLKIGLVFK